MITILTPTYLNLRGKNENQSLVQQTLKRMEMDTYI